jgi:hypothetical protein
MKVTAYKVPPNTLLTLVEWAQAGLDSLAGRAYASQKDRELIHSLSRKLNPWTLPTGVFSVQRQPLSVPQLDATEQLANKKADRDDPHFYHRKRG